MSDVLFPELPGLEWELTKTPIFNTKIMTSVSGRELRASYQAVPKYDISMSFAFLRENKGRTELQLLESFFLARRGAFDSFLYKMPEDSDFACTFVGDGSTTTYALHKQMFEMQIPIGHTQPTTEPANPNMWNQVNDKSMWNTNTAKLMWNQATAGITADGQLVLSEPLEDGQQVSVMGTYYYRCRFKDDEQQYVNFMHQLWKAQKVELIGSLGNKI